MGSVLSTASMRPPSYILLVTLVTVFLLGPHLVLSKSPADCCSCLDLAHVRTLIPDDIVGAKQFLYQMQKYEELDLCKTKFQDLPLTTLSSWDINIYRPKRGQDIKLGELLQKQAGELKIEAQKIFWKNWLENHANVDVNCYNMTCLLKQVEANMTVEDWINWAE